MIDADDPDCGDIAVHRVEVKTQVRGTSGLVLLFGHMEDGDWRIWGEAIGIAVELLIEHEVADNDCVERFPVGESGEECFHKCP